MYKIKRILKDTGMQVGQKSESKVAKAIEQLQIDLEQEWDEATRSCEFDYVEDKFLISTYWKTENLSHKDKTGIDFELVVDLGNGSSYRIPLQVKSSNRWKEEHLKKFPDIPCIVVQSNRSIASIKEELRQIIVDYLAVGG